MEILADIYINDRLYSDILLSDNELEDFVESNITKNDLENFKKKSVKVIIKEKEPELKIYLLTTNLKGYDTYRSGVFTGYSVTEALENATLYSSQFEGASVKLIGYAVNENIEKTICTHFVSG